jgi:hypothetical protein
MVGLPPEEFERAYAAGYDIAAAERCGAALDAGAVRHALVTDVERRGHPTGIADKAGRAFDKTRTEFTQKLHARPDYCVTEYAVPPERLAQYAKGEFSAACSRPRFDHIPAPTLVTTKTGKDPEIQICPRSVRPA